MCDEPKPPVQGQRPTQARSALGRIADALGVPVSSFEERGRGGAEIDETALLALVRTYLRSAEPDARGRFIRAVMAMAETDDRPLLP